MMSWRRESDCSDLCVLAQPAKADRWPITIRDWAARSGGHAAGAGASIRLGTLAEKLKIVAEHRESLKVVGGTWINRSTLLLYALAVAVASWMPRWRSGAQVYVSGDLGYHTARDAQQAGIGLIDIGHFGSERLIVDALASSIRDVSKTRGLDVTVEAATIETDPFHHL